MTFMPASWASSTARLFSAPGCIQTSWIPSRDASITTFSVTCGCVTIDRPCTGCGRLERSGNAAGDAELIEAAREAEFSVVEE